MPPEPLPNPKENISQFERLLAGLAGAGIDFAVVGGLAVILNGYPRVTVDVHILVHDAFTNLTRLLEYLARWGEGHARQLTIADFPPEEGSVRVMEEFDLDIFTRMQGKSLDDFRPRLRHFQSGAVTIRYLAPDDLVRLKEGSWREKDQLDVQAMREIMQRERPSKN